MDPGGVPQLDYGHTDEAWVILDEFDSGRLSPVSISSVQHNTDEVLNNFESVEFQRFRNNVAPNLHLHLHNNFFSNYGSTPGPQSSSLTPALALFPNRLNNFQRFQMSSTNFSPQVDSKAKFVDIDLNSDNNETKPKIEKLESFRSDKTEAGQRMVEAENLNTFFSDQNILKTDEKHENNTNNSQNANVSSNSSISSLDENDNENDNEENFNKLFSQIQQEEEGVLNESEKKYNGRNTPVLKSQTCVQKEEENLSTEEFIKFLQKRKLDKLQKQKTRKLKSLKTKKKTSFSTKKQSSIVELIFRINEFFSGNLFSHVFALLLGVYIGQKYVAKKH